MMQLPSLVGPVVVQAVGTTMQQYTGVVKASDDAMKVHEEDDKSVAEEESVFPSASQLRQQQEQQLQEFELEEGMPVIIAGLEGAPHLNCLSGFLLGFDVASGRRKVDIEGAGFKATKASNLVFDEHCETEDEDGNGAVSMCVSGRPDHDVKGS